MTSRLLSKSELGQLLGIHANSVPRLVREGRFPPPLRFSSTWIGWPEADIAEWLRLVAAGTDQHAAARRITEARGGDMAR
jgi:predicted DNA-binding transcriptional regulator AlpA